MNSRFAMAVSVPPSNIRLEDLVEIPEHGGRWHFPYNGGEDGGEYSSIANHEWLMAPTDAPASRTDEFYGRPSTVYYDPARTQVSPGEFRHEYTNKGNRITDLNPPAGMLWRGMSDEEYQAAVQNGYFESPGEYNIGGESQVGKTYFSTGPDHAESYANGFAPWQYRPTFTRPGHIIGIPDRPDIPREGGHEVGIPGRIPFDEAVHHYVGHPYAIAPGTYRGISNKYDGQWDEVPPYRSQSASSYLEWEDDSPVRTVQAAYAAHRWREGSQYFFGYDAHSAAADGGFSEPVNQLMGRLHQEFTDWATPLHDKTEWPHGGRWAPEPKDLVGEWPWVERFLKERYPAAHQGFDMGREEARPAINKRKDNPYPTGSEAIAQYGYDPKEIAAGMLLLHIPGGTRHINVPKNVLNNIFKQRQQMQRDYEKRQAARLAMAWDAWAPKIKGGCQTCTDGWEGRYTIPQAGAFLNYAHATHQGQPAVKVIGIYTHPSDRGDGVAEALMRRLADDHPGAAIIPGMMTTDGQHFHDRMLDKEPTARDRVTAQAKIALNQQLVDSLHDDFHQWWSQTGRTWDYDEEGDEDRRGPIGEWPNIEAFLKDTYPEAHRSLTMGLEQVRHLLDGRDAHDESAGLNLLHWRGPAHPYETGQSAIAQYGYDPKEIAAGMLLLHNRSHPGRGYRKPEDEQRLTDIAQSQTLSDIFDRHEDIRGEMSRSDVDTLADVAQKRQRMQGSLQASPQTAPDLVKDYTDSLSKEFHDWAKEQPYVPVGFLKDDPLVKNPDYSQPMGGPLAYWENIEGFLQDRYPAVHRGFAYGQESAAATLDGQRVNFPPRHEGFHPPYETGPEAVEKYGYDPRQVAAGFMYLHSLSHSRAQRIPRDIDRLSEIFQKRQQMQRDYEQRQTTAARTASSLLVGPEDAYDEWDWFKRHYENPPGSIDVTTKDWYHVSPHRMPVGTVLAPMRGDTPWNDSPYDHGLENRANWVWVEFDKDKARRWMHYVLQHQPECYIYRVEPELGPFAWNGTADEGWVTTRAKVTEYLDRLSRDVSFQEMP